MTPPDEMNHPGESQGHSRWVGGVLVGGKRYSSIHVSQGYDRFN